MQLNPARGRKLLNFGRRILMCKVWFMQLNPARGRKLSYVEPVGSPAAY